MKPDGTFTVAELLEICNTQLQSWERDELADKLITYDRIADEIRDMDPSDISYLTGYYFAKEEPEPDINDFSTSDLIEELQYRLRWMSITKNDRESLLKTVTNASILDD